MALIVSNEGHNLTCWVCCMCVPSMCWSVCDPKWVVVNDLNSIWSSTSLCCISNFATWSYDVATIYVRCYRWCLCQQIWLFQAWCNGGQWQSGNSANVQGLQRHQCAKFVLKVQETQYFIVTNFNYEGSCWVHCGTLLCANIAMPVRC